MKTNMGTFDRVFRILVALVIGGLYYGDIVSGTVGIVLLVLAGVFVLTSLVSFCPIYSIFGLRTCAVKNEKA
ncbi:MAG: DUF2892 domain-containing protein [Flammeovirgaceae bacterium]|nr:DUF2892 domain-containing protein [Flammeovirgaceae bacterium]